MHAEHHPSRFQSAEPVPDETPAADAENVMPLTPEEKYLLATRDETRHAVADALCAYLVAHGHVLQHLAAIMDSSVDLYVNDKQVAACARETADIFLPALAMIAGRIFEREFNRLPAGGRTPRVPQATADRRRGSS